MALDAPPLPPPAPPAPPAPQGAPAGSVSKTALGRSMSARALDDPFAHDDHALRALATPQGVSAAVLAQAEQTHRIAFLDGLIDMSNVLVSLLENNRTDLRGHSSLVARLAKRMCERLTLPKEEMQAIVLAAHLHDLAKMGSFHLTALNVADYDGHRAAAEKVVETPARLMEAVKLPAATSEALRHMYERWDGSGFPQKLSGKDIALGARILAVSDVYADLTQNPRNPYRKPLGAPEACAALEQHKERIFDPHLVDLFKTVVMGEDMKARLLETSRRALVIDPDPEESTVLELRMIEQGFEVLTARTVEAARLLLAKGTIELVVSELQLPDGNGLDLLAEARSSSWGKDLPWVIHTGAQHRSDAQRAFELGALDYVSKPAPTEVLVAKLRALTGAAKKTVARGVSGSLGEMGIPDIVQVLFQGRKTGKLLLRSGSFTGEIYFLDGAIADAGFENKRGADAFYMLMRLTEGEFVLDSSFVPSKRVIEESGETLLLEGLRRLDEGLP
jgi:response regulator RpfG family c-di-GMP phosphodiesterase